MNNRESNSDLAKTKRKINAVLNIILVAIIAAALVAVIGISLYRLASLDFTPSEGNQVLSIQTYIDGKNQVTHPSVIDVGNEWNGYRYWMAYSPYPYGNGGEENPCLAVSNDMLQWTTPEGLYNPIANNEETGCDELKDPHIVFNPDQNVLEVWYLGRMDSTIEEGGDLILFRKTSSDGIHWSNYEVMRTLNGTLSPSIIYDNNTYKMWTIVASGNQNAGQLLYSETEDGVNWSDHSICRFGEQSSLDNIWHGAVSYDGEYHFVFIPCGSESEVIYYCESQNGNEWTSPTPIITKGNYWAGYYRPYLVKSEGLVYCLYGVITNENEWYLSMSTGENVSEMRGYSPVDGGSIYTVKSKIQTIAKDIYQSTKTPCNLQVIIISFAVGMLGLWLLKSKMNSVVWLFAWLLSWLRYLSTWQYEDIVGKCVVLIVTGVLSFLVVKSIESLITSKSGAENASKSAE